MPCWAGSRRRKSRPSSPSTAEASDKRRRGDRPQALPQKRRGRPVGRPLDQTILSRSEDLGQVQLQLDDALAWFAHCALVALALARPLVEERVIGGVGHDRLFGLLGV